MLLLGIQLIMLWDRAILVVGKRCHFPLGDYPVTAKTAAAKDPNDALLLKIASKHFHSVDTPEACNSSDLLNFHDVAVWSIRAALESAFAAGQAFKC